MTKQRQKQSAVDSTYGPAIPNIDVPDYPGCSAAASSLNAEEARLDALAGKINKLKEDLPIALGACLDTAPKDGKPDSTLYWLTSKACRDYTQMKYDYEKDIEKFRADRGAYEEKVKKWNKDNQLQECPNAIQCNNNVVKLSGFTLLRSSDIILGQPNLSDFKACKEHTAGRILEYRKEKAALQEFKAGLESAIGVITAWPIGAGAPNAPEFVSYTPGTAPNKYPLFKTINPDGTLSATPQWTIQPKSTGETWKKKERAEAVPIVAGWMDKALGSFPDIRKVEPKKELDLDKEQVVELYYFFESPTYGSNFINVVKKFAGVDPELTFSEKTLPPDDNDDYPNEVKVTVTISIDKLKELNPGDSKQQSKKRLNDIISKIQSVSQQKQGEDFRFRPTSTILPPWKGLSPNAYLKLGSVLTNYYFNEYQYGYENDHGQKTLMSLEKRLIALDDHISKLSSSVAKLDGIIQRWETNLATYLMSVKKEATDTINNAIRDNQEITVKNVTISYTVADQEATTPAVSFTPDGDLNRFIKEVLSPTQSKEQAIEINMKAAIGATNKKAGEMSPCPKTPGGRWTKPISCTVTVERTFNKEGAKRYIQNSFNINRPFVVECGPNIFVPIIMDENDDPAPNPRKGGFVYLPGQESTNLYDKIPEMTVKTATATACEGFN